VQACSIKLRIVRESDKAVPSFRQGTSEEGLGWSKLLQQKDDYSFCAGVVNRLRSRSCRKAMERRRNGTPATARSSEVKDANSNLSRTCSAARTGWGKKIETHDEDVMRDAL